MPCYSRSLLSVWVPDCVRRPQEAFRFQWQAITNQYFIQCHSPVLVFPKLMANLLLLKLLITFETRQDHYLKALNFHPSVISLSYLKASGVHPEPLLLSLDVVLLPARPACKDSQHLAGEGCSICTGQHFQIKTVVLTAVY